jgi:UDP-N-acetylglucosamine 2-epimerase (non-hydrolysing)
MAPLVKLLEAHADIDSVVCVTGQHKTMLQQVLDLFEVTPKYNLAVMTENQTLNALSARLLVSLDQVLETERPDRVLVHGDTTTAAIAALAAFHRRIPVGHVEAGLRTGDLQQPWPEEMNRRMVDMIADMLFAPTAGARLNLAHESLQARVFVTGNTVVDALLATVARIERDPGLQDQLDARLPVLDARRPIVLVTGHRRENFGTGFEQICAALADLAALQGDAALQIVYPVHLNPNVREPVRRLLGARANVHLIEPLDYLGFVRLMQRATLILTDSGGVQEEAPALGIPVLVMRDVTERPEAIAAGTALLVGTQRASIREHVMHLLAHPQQRLNFAQRSNPYGDGQAAQRIVAALTGAAFEEFSAVVAPSAEIARWSQSSSSDSALRH